MTAPPRDSSTVRVCPVRDIVCSTPNECDQRETGCMMLINLPPELDHLCAATAPSAEPIKNRVSDGSRQFPPNRDPGRVSLPMKGNDDDESYGGCARGVAGEGDGNHLRSGCRDGEAGRDRSGEHDAGLLHPQQHADRCGGNATRLLIDNETLRQQIAADPDDSEPSAGSVEPPVQAATDDLVRRFDCFTREDGVYESATGAHVAYADYALLRATVERQAREIARMGRVAAGYEGRICAANEQAQRDWQRAERAERERDELRAARIAYASEFPTNTDGESDTGSIHANIRALKAERDAMRADAERLYRMVDTWHSSGSQQADDMLAYDFDVYREEKAADAARAKVKP